MSARASGVMTPSGIVLNPFYFVSNTAAPGKTVRSPVGNSINPAAEASIATSLIDELARRAQNSKNYSWKSLTTRTLLMCDDEKDLYLAHLGQQKETFMRITVGTSFNPKSNTITHIPSSEYKLTDVGVQAPFQLSGNPIFRSLFPNADVCDAYVHALRKRNISSIDFFTELGKKPTMPCVPYLISITPTVFYLGAPLKPV